MKFLNDRFSGKDLTGMVFGRLTVLKLHSIRNAPGRRMAMWQCICECGKIRVVFGQNLTRSKINSASCGCAAKCNALTHGMTDHPIYRSWLQMRKRCFQKSWHGYRHYGGRGIIIDSRWSKFQNFFSDMGEKWRPDLTLDRKDSNGNYCKSNCRWATIKQQQRNRRNNQRLLFSGENLTVVEWAEKMGINSKCLYARVYRGWSTKEILTTPMRKSPANPNCCINRPGVVYGNP